MTGFNERKDTFEKKFAHDEALQFRAAAKRNKKLAAWAMEKMGRAGEAQAYFEALTAADFEEAGDDDVFRRISSDFKAAGVAVEEPEIRNKMAEAMAEAHSEVKNAL